MDYHLNLEETMKTLNILIIVSLLLFFLSSCKNTSESGDNGPAIMGKWNWVKSEGWPGSTTPEKVGYTKQIVFRIDGTYSEYRNNLLYMESDYSIVKKDIDDDNIDESIIDIQNLSFEYQIDSIQNDTLLLKILFCADCRDSEYYTKVK